MAENVPTDNDPGSATPAEAAKDELDYVEYYDEGEWHAVLMDGNHPVGSGYGGSPEEARKSLFGTAEID